MNIVQSLGGFIACAALITFSGVRITRKADRIAELTGLGKAWLGLFLLASVTTLPELITGISSVAIVDAPNLAVGNAIGSCVFNLLILSLIDLKTKENLSSMVKSSHIFAGLFSIILLAIVAIAIIIDHPSSNILWMSPFTPALIIIFLLASRGVYAFEQKSTPGEKRIISAQSSKGKELQRAFITFIANALIIIIAAVFLPYFGESLAAMSRFDNTSFGTIFMAATTSLPELIVAFAAIRIGSYDLSVGNLFGANMFNMFILGVDDIFYNKGSLFAFIMPEHQISMLAVIVMTAVMGLGMLYKPVKRYWHLGLDTIVILLTYIGLMIYLLS